MGTTQTDAPISEISDLVSDKTKSDGCQSGSIYGTYVHGIFDGDEVAGGIIRSLAAKKGVDPSKLGAVSGAEYKEQQYDLLAETLRKSMEIKKIYRILEEGIR